MTKKSPDQTVLKVVDYCSKPAAVFCRTVTAIAILLIAVWPSNAVSQPACPDLKPYGVSADVLQHLSRGMNAAGWMDSDSSPAPKIELLKRLRASGITHIRLPIPAERLMVRFSPEPVVKAQLLRVEKALVALHDLGFAVSVDLHPGDEFNQLHRSDAGAALDAAKDAWRRLSVVFEPYSPTMVYAELLNEPDIDAAVWQAQIVELATYVRKLLPRTPLIVGPVNWQRADSLPAFRPLDDLNVVYAIHFYDPMVFTHQGHWDASDPMHAIRGLRYPLKPDAPDVRRIKSDLANASSSALRDLNDAIAETEKGDLIDNALEPAVKWQQQFGRPILINEFGVLKAAAPRDSRIHWLQAVVEKAESHCWGWAHWELEQGFGLTDDSGRLDLPILNALTGHRAAR